YIYIFIFLFIFFIYLFIYFHVGWCVTYSPSQICAIKGSTVDLQCNFTYPSKIDNIVTVVESIKWFTKGTATAPIDLKNDPDYAGRVEYGTGCTVRIRNIGEADSAFYKIRFKTNHKHGIYTGVPGVKLSVSGLKLNVIKSERRNNHNWTKMKCKSSCLPDQHPYIWIKNGQEILAESSSVFSYEFRDKEHISCAAKGYEKFPSPSVYVPKLPVVSLIPSGEIKEGMSLTLTCSSDANPAANYSWFNKNEKWPQYSIQNLTIANIGQQHSGLYYCEAINKRGSHKSAIHVTVFASKLDKAPVKGHFLYFMRFYILPKAIFNKLKKVSGTDFNASTLHLPPSDNNFVWFFLNILCYII
uniref:Ig-like domain-containing protein n=1 Tax=Cyprinodon variegatus TaxID=28743 RepID=A0A3Q2FEN0_CYPVA